MQPAPAATAIPAQAPPFPAALTLGGASWRSALAQGNRVPLARPVISLGRLATNSIELLDPAVSRHHAVIRWGASDYELEDLGSANGTYLQGQRITGRVPLVPGQMIRIGATEMVFNVLAQAPGVAPQGGPLRVAGPQAPTAVAGAAAGGAAAYPFYAAMAQPHWLARTLRSQAPKRYWRVLLGGLVAYAALSAVLTATGNLHLVPLVLLLASVLVPAVFVLFCWEQSAFADMPPAVVGVTFVSGALLGLTLAAVVEPVLLAGVPETGGLTLAAALMVGVVEESAKVASVLWFLRDRRLRSELDGLILGAAAGMGFAALETAGYGFVAFLAGFTQALNTPQATVTSATVAAVSTMNHQLILRMALAIFGHGVWTGIVCAVIWRERGAATFRLTAGVLIAFGIAVGLHALWDWAPVVYLLPAGADPLSELGLILLWFLAIGTAGLYVLGRLLREALQRAQLGPSAPPPGPLLAMLFGGGRQRQPAYVPVPSPYGMPPAGAQAIQTPGLAPPQPPYPAQPQPPQAVRSVYCPRCNLMYPPGTTTCARCGGALAPLP
jgi:RsiW-degrading membrane proteinase PrsW (M82 family)